MHAYTYCIVIIVIMHFLIITWLPGLDLLTPKLVHQSHIISSNFASILSLVFKFRGMIN